MPSPKVQRRNNAAKAHKVRQKKLLTSSELCSHCCTPFSVTGTQSVFHPLWPTEYLCNKCSKIIARCSICERKAVPWSMPREEGSVEQYDVLIHTLDGDGILSPRVQLLPEIIDELARFVCGRCRAVGLIATKSQAVHELRFILESLYLNYGIIFDHHMLEYQRIYLSRSKEKMRSFKSEFPPHVSESQFESWLAMHCEATANLLPIQLFWGTETQLERAACETGYFSDNCHPTIMDKPYVQRIMVESHTSRPKFWALMVHEIIHAYLHLKRGTHHEASTIKDHEARIHLEDGLAHAITVLTLEEVANDIGLAVPHPTKFDLEYGPPPVQLWQINSSGFLEDLPHSRPPPENYLQQWTRSFDKSIFYDIVHEEFVQVQFVLNKIMTDTPYENKLKRALNLIRKRIAERPNHVHDVIDRIMTEFIKSDYLPKF